MVFRCGLQVALPFALLAVAACSLPIGSFARPVEPLDRGETMIAGTANFVAVAVDHQERQPLPPQRGTVGGTVSADFGIIPGQTSAGAAFGLLPIDRTTRLWYLGLRTERRFTRLPSLSFLGELNFGLVRRQEPSNLAEAPLEEPLWVDAFPLTGLRYYVPIGTGGLVLTQTLGLTFVSVTAPGSLAGDIAFLDFHLFPEVRWDPTYHAFDGHRIFATLSVNATLAWRF
jgi:hypothetical protein